MRSWINSGYSKLSSIKRRFSVVVFSDGGSARMAVIGDETQAPVLAKRYFGGEAPVGRSVRPRFGRLLSEAERLKNQCGMVLVSNLSVSNEIRDRALWCPASVEMGMPLPPTVPDFEQSLRDRLRLEIKNVRESIAWEFCQDEQHLRAFHEGYNLPTIRSSHGERANEASYERIRAELDQGCLVRFFHDGRWVAGLLLGFCGKALSMRHLGVLGGDRKGVPRLTSTAIYLAAIEFGIENAYETIEFGAVDPDPQNGLFYFKDKWGGLVCSERTHRPPHFILIDPGHPQCRRFFESGALFFWEGEKLSLLTGVRSKEALQKMERKTRSLQGVERVYTIREEYSGAFSGGAGVAGVPAALRDRVFRVR